MFIDFLISVFEENKGKEAIIWRDRTYTYDSLLRLFERFGTEGSPNGIISGSVVALDGNFTPNSIALLFLLIERECIVVPLNNRVKTSKQRQMEIAQVDVLLQVGLNDEVSVSRHGRVSSHELYKVLRERQHPGLVLFTSGTSGEPKGAVHDFVPLLDKFKTRRASLRTLNFLLFDHWGGLNTMFHILSNAGVLISVEDFSPDAICSLIEKHKVELLPASPTFFNLYLMSEAYKRFDLSSLKLVTYGAEPMPEETLRRLRAVLPWAKLQQTYGLIELGVLRSKSKGDDSLWLQVGGEGYETRVVDGILQIKAKSAMLGYLNAASPFTEDGWFITGDAVEVDGEFIRILSRKSEIINVGGEKVYPVEVESVIQSMPGVEEVVVSGIPNPITGQIVEAKVKLNSGETLSEFRARMRDFCRDKLAPFKIPQKVVLVDSALHGERFKKLRRGL